MACDGNHQSIMEGIGSLRERVAKLEATIKTAGVIMPILTSMVTAFAVFIITK